MDQGLKQLLVIGAKRVNPDKILNLRKETHKLAISNNNVHFYKITNQ